MGGLPAGHRRATGTGGRRHRERRNVQRGAYAEGGRVIERIPPEDYDWLEKAHLNLTRAHYVDEATVRRCADRAAWLWLPQHRAAEGVPPARYRNLGREEVLTELSRLGRAAEKRDAEAVDKRIRELHEPSIVTLAYVVDENGKPQGDPATGCYVLGRDRENYAWIAAAVSRVL